MTGLLIFFAIILLGTIGVAYWMNWLDNQHQKKENKEFCNEIPLSQASNTTNTDKYLEYTSILGLILWLPGVFYSLYLGILSFQIFYNKIYLWLKKGQSIDVSTYTCLTSNSKFCSDITSNPPFNYIPQEFVRWIFEPKDWLGLHSAVKYLLEGFPMWLLGFLVAGLILLMWAALMTGVVLLMQEGIKDSKSKNS